MKKLLLLSLCFGFFLSVSAINVDVGPGSDTNSLVIKSDLPAAVTAECSDFAVVDCVDLVPDQIVLGHYHPAVVFPLVSSSDVVSVVAPAPAYRGPPFRLS